MRCKKFLFIWFVVQVVKCNLILLLFFNRVKAKLQETAPNRVDPFMSNAPSEVKKILANIKNFQVDCRNC